MEIIVAGTDSFDQRTAARRKTGQFGSGQLTSAQRGSIVDPHLPK